MCVELIAFVGKSVVIFNILLVHIEDLLEREQVFTGMAVDEVTGRVFLSSPKVSGRVAALSYFNILPSNRVAKLYPFPEYNSPPEVN